MQQNIQLFTTRENSLKCCTWLERHTDQSEIPSKPLPVTLFHDKALLSSDESGRCN